MSVSRQVTAFRAGPFVVNGFEDPALDAHIAKALTHGLKGIAPSPGGRGTSPGRAADVSGTAEIVAAETRVTDGIRRWDAEGKTLKPDEVPVLVRKVDIVVNFVVTLAPGGERLAAVEARRAYNSADDPRVRGELGLQRPGDPARVPAAGQVVRELLDDCIDSFCRMIAPDELALDVRLRGTLGAGGGMKAAGEGDFPAAARHFEKALSGSPESAALLFNLAVVSEAAGRLDTAMKYYGRVTELSKGRDAEAEEATRRIRRVRARRRPPGPGRG